MMMLKVEVFGLEGLDVEAVELTHGQIISARVNKEGWSRLLMRVPDGIIDLHNCADFWSTSVTLSNIRHPKSATLKVEF